MQPMLHAVHASNATLATASGWCGADSLYARSYALPPHFPFPPIRLVMERIPGRCDLYKPYKSFCTAMQAGKTFEPEYHVREVIASFLTGCHARRCAALDLGANNGWFTAYMLSLGASVTAIEPQPDLARAAAETVELNCWSSRAQVLAGFLQAHSTAEREVDLVGFKGWRAGNARGEGSATTGLSSRVPVILLDDLLIRTGTRTFELLKLDADGPEGSWLHRIDHLITSGDVNIKTMVVEGHNVSAGILHRMQKTHGYGVYLLDMHIDRR